MGMGRATLMTALASAIQVSLVLKNVFSYYGMCSQATWAPAPRHTSICRLQSVISYHRMCSLTASQNVFSYHQMRPLTIECVLRLFRRRLLDLSQHLGGRALLFFGPRRPLRRYHRHGMFVDRGCSLTVEGVLLLQKVFSCYRRCSLKVESILLLQKVFSCYRRCSLRRAPRCCHRRGEPVYQYVTDMYDAYFCVYICEQTCVMHLFVCTYVNRRV